MTFEEIKLLDQAAETLIDARALIRIASDLLQPIGNNGDLIAALQEVLTSIHRVRVQIELRTDRTEVVV